MSGRVEVAAVRPLVGEALLAAWEQGAGLPPVARASVLLNAGYPSLSGAEADSLSLPVRDGALLRLRTESFGASLVAFAECEACGERLEFELPSSRLVASLAAVPEECVIAQDGYTLRVRLASAGDVAAAAARPDLDAACALLAKRCIAVCDAVGCPVPFDGLPPDLQATALHRLEQMHSASELSLALACPACAASQHVFFDIAAFLWAELRHSAQHLLDEVHELAWTYGWAENAILAMSARRRQAYLDRLRA